MPKPIANKPVHTSSFHHESFSVTDKLFKIAYKKKRIQETYGKYSRQKLPWHRQELVPLLQEIRQKLKIPHRYGASLSMWLPKNQTDGLNKFKRTVEKNYKPLYPKMLVDDYHVVVDIFVLSNFAGSVGCPHFLNFVCYIVALSISWHLLCVVVVVWWPAPSEFP